MTAVPAPEATTPMVERDGRLHVAIVTGMSGAGRTEAAKVLEDLGYFVIDNLPPTLLSKVIELAARPASGFETLALVADVRGREFFVELMGSLDELRRSGVDTRVLFLEASDDALLNRFETSRRRHPLEAGGGLNDGIARERALLRDLRGTADLVLDTTDLNVHELRDRIIEAFGRPDRDAMHVTVTSFGFKYGLPRDADLLMDVRFLPNPHWVQELRPRTGEDEAVRRYVLDRPEAARFLELFLGLLDSVVPGYRNEGKRYLSIAIGCTGGKHRSITIANEVAAHLEATTDLPVRVEHRDLGRE